MTPNDLEIGRATVELRNQLKRAIFDVGETARRHAIVPGYDPPLAEHNACMLVDDVVLRAFRLGAASAEKKPVGFSVEQRLGRLESFARCMATNRPPARTENLQAILDGEQPPVQS